MAVACPVAVCPVEIAPADVDRREVRGHCPLHPVSELNVLQIAVKFAKIVSAPRKKSLQTTALFLQNHCPQTLLFILGKLLRIPKELFSKSSFGGSKGRAIDAPPWRFPLRSFYRSFSRRLPQKKTATVPGPVCEPIVVPISLISTLPFRCGKAASIIAATAFASSRQAEWEI